MFQIAADLNKPKPAIWIEAGTHAREKITVSTALNLIQTVSIILYRLQFDRLNDMMICFVYSEVWKRERERERERDRERESSSSKVVVRFSFAYCAVKCVLSSFHKLVCL